MLITLNYGEVNTLLEEYYQKKYDNKYKINIVCSVEEIIIPDSLGMDNGYTKYKFHGVVKLSTDIVL